MKTYRFKTSVLSASLIALMSLNTAYATETDAVDASRSYVDPITGETKEAKKLLSEMSDTEKALLSNEEYVALKELEAKLEAAKAAQAELGTGE